MKLEHSNIEELRELPVIPFYLPNEEAYAEYKRTCERHLLELYKSDNSLYDVVTLDIAKSILRANIAKRKDHSRESEYLAQTGKMPPYSGAVAAHELGSLADVHLTELISNRELPSMELEARITVGESRPFLDRSLPDQVTGDMADFLNANGHSAQLQSWPTPNESIKLSRGIRGHREHGRYAVIKSKTESSHVVEVENGHPRANLLQVIGRQTSMLWLAELDSDEAVLLEKLAIEFAPEDYVALEAVKRDVKNMLGDRSDTVHPVIERAYVRCLPS